MKLSVLFGQRECSYDGEFLPEALEIAGEEVIDDNPEWLEEQYDKYNNDGEFERVEWVDIHLDDKSTNAIYDRFLFNLGVAGEVK